MRMGMRAKRGKPAAADGDNSRRPPAVAIVGRYICRVVGEVAILRRSAYPEVLRDVPPGMAIRLHSLRGRDVLRVLNLAGASEPGAVGTRYGSFEGSALLGQLPLVFSE